MTADVAAALSEGGPLHALTAYRQFVNYADDKRPLSPHGGAASSTDPSTWGTATDALATGRPVGFVLTDDDPFFFLDIDKHLVDGVWSPVATELCAALGACAVEVSKSGTGLHIFGTGTLPPHSNRNTDQRLELYTSQRYAALTGSGARGNVLTDATGPMAAIVARYFRPRPASARDAAVSDGPREDWRGSTDDDDLIRRARQSKSSAALFGGKASFDDLWLADADALAKHFPPTKDYDRWNRSNADAALASHLAFWTGCDGPRIERLMRASGLALDRDKWDDRPDYLSTTIARACAACESVCQDKERPAAVAPAPVETDAAGSFVRPARGSTLDGLTMAPLWAGHVYIESQNRVFCPDGEILSGDAFDTRFGGYQFFMKEGNEGAGAIKDSAFLAFRKSSRFACERVSQPEFDPTRPPGQVFERDGRRYVNNYIPLAVDRRPGDVQPFLDHLSRLLPVKRDADILLYWMAAVVQHPGHKFLWSPVVVGGKGDGKSILFEKILTAAVGERYSDTVKPAQMNAKHGTWMLDRVFALCDDVGKFVTDEWLDDVKTIITGRRQMVEPKGVNMYMARVCTNIAFTSNHRRNIRVTPDERRFAVLWCESPGAELTARFASWTDDPANVAACAHMLATVAIPVELNPYHVKNAPATSSMAQAVRGSSDAIDQIVEDAIEEGAQGFTGGLICMQDLERLLEARMKRPVSRSVREEVLQRLGYVPHAHAGAKPDGWVNNPVKEAGGKRLRFFVKAGHPAAQLPNGPAVAKHYVESQVPIAGFG